MLITTALLTLLACPTTPHAEPDPPRPVHGLVLQEGTDLPLADLTLELREIPDRRSLDAGGPRPTPAQATVITDARGRFVTDQPFPEGRLMVSTRGTEVRALSSRSERVTLDASHDERNPLTIRLDVPRKAELEVRPPVGYTLDDLRARALPDGHHHTALSQWPGGVALRESDAGGRPWLRRTEPKWRPARDLEREGLFVYTEDGYWGGRAVPLPTTGPETLAFGVQLEPLGALELTLTPPASADTTGPAGAIHRTERVTLADAAGLEVLVYLGPGAPRSVKWLPPGRWSVASDEHWYSAVRGEVEVTPGRTARLELFPESAHPTGTLTLRVMEADGDVPAWKGFGDAPDISATVRNREGGRTYSVKTTALCGNGVEAWFQRVERDGRMVLEANLGPIAMADYEVELRADGRAYEGPRKVRPGEPAIYVMQAARLGFRVRSAQTGEPLGGYRVVNLRPDAHPQRLSEHPLEVLAPGVSLHALDARRHEVGDWCLLAPGHRRVYGSRYDFRQSPDGAWAEVELEPGWGLRLVAREAESGWASGVAIAFGDGEVTTDKGGRAMLVADEAPADPRLRFDGWRVVSGDVTPDGRFNPEAHELRVTLERIR